MTYLYNEAFRAHVSEQCAEFRPLQHPSGAGGLKRAAVAIALTAAGDGERAALLLTRRAAKLRSHGGQWALPGGRCDEGETPVETALREMHEELGLKLDNGDVLGVLDEYASRSGYLISPVIAWAPANAAIAPNPQEVASVHRIPLDSMIEDGIIDFISIPESDRPVIRIYINGRHVHAPTAAVIYQFLELVAGRDTRVAHLEQPVFAWK